MVLDPCRPVGLERVASLSEVHHGGEEDQCDDDEEDEDEEGVEAFVDSRHEDLEDRGVPGDAQQPEGARDTEDQHRGLLDKKMHRVGEGGKGVRRETDTRSS